MADLSQRFLSRMTLALLCLALVGVPRFLAAQDSGVSICGTVTDSTEAALIDVMVSAIDSKGDVSRETKTDEYGKYCLDSLPPGSYTLKAEGEGLKAGERSAVELVGGAKKLVDFKLTEGRDRIPPQLEKSRPVTMAELAKMKTEGVSVVEVSDYVFGGYQGDFPSPPHADHNPKKAFIIFWKNFPYRFVFSHEGSYCPWFELPSGAALCYQFFEGNKGWAELFNEYGRKEENSFVEVLEQGPRRVWVRWTYFGVNMQAGQRAYRATEDFWAYPNGLILRRQKYEPIISQDYRGYSREPIEIIGMCPAGKLWFNVLAKDPTSGWNHALAVLDAFSSKRYDVYWRHKPGTVWDSTHRRTGCEWKDVDNSPGVVLAVPFLDGTPYCIFGDASGFRHDYTNLKDHTFVAEIWGSSCWDHWPIGWLNSQGHPVDATSLRSYPNHFSPMGLDFFALPDKEEERGVYYSLLGVAGSDLGPTRDLARKWLETGAAAITNPDTLRTLRPGVQGGDPEGGK